MFYNLGHNLGLRYDRTGNDRYERTGQLQDLEAGIALSEAAIEATPEGHPDRAGCLNNLGNRLSSRYRRTGDLQDLDTVIDISEAAIVATPEDRPDRVGLLSNLGVHLSRRYERTGHLPDQESHCYIGGSNRGNSGGPP